LLSNAIKFTANGSVTMNIKSDYKGDQDKFDLIIDVQDTGIGIPPEKQSSIFSKFQQADASTARQYGGTGLGLAITKDLIELMGGNITLNSVEGTGTCFTISIPVEISHANLNDMQGDNETRIVQFDKNKTILIVDDHPVNLLFMRKTMKKMNFINVDEAQSGMDAIELYNKKHHEIILMDCQMPGMDGFTASNKIRAIKHPVTPTIIAVTADAMRGAAQKCKDAGMDDYISKPVEFEKLQAVLQKYISYEMVDGTQSSQAASRMSTDEIDIFDWDHLSEFTDGDEEVERQILNVFRHGLAEDIKELDATFAIRDFPKWVEVTHKLYGGASNIKAGQLASLCNRGQYLSHDTYDEINDLHVGIIAAYGRLKDVLDKGKIHAQ
jgi:CheY-like chemotaxis protein